LNTAGRRKAGRGDGRSGRKHGVDCQEFQRCITAAVDRRLSDEDLRSFHEHAGTCFPCRNEFEVERVTKSVVRARVGMVQTPADLMERISDCLDTESRHPHGAVPLWWDTLRNSLYLKPLLAFAAGAAAVILLLNDPDEATGIRQASLLPGNVLEQSLLNYHAVVNGTILPEIEGTTSGPVEEFFRGKTTFPVHVPQMRECDRVGGTLNTYSGVALAHLVYRLRGEVVYLYQACWKEVQKGSTIALPEEVRDDLRRTGWHTISRSDGYSMVLWTQDGTLCSAVAHLPAQELRACLEGTEKVGE